jgi:hypothetical protein
VNGEEGVKPKSKGSQNYLLVELLDFVAKGNRCRPSILLTLSPEATLCLFSGSLLPIGSIERTLLRSQGAVNPGVWLEVIHVPEVVLNLTLPEHSHEAGMGKLLDQALV